jgi:hypothetical protein
MPTTNLQKFIPTIRALSQEELNGSASLYEKMRIVQDDKIQVCYAPFEYLNPKARLVIVGITPGKTQMVNAIREARKQLDADASPMQTLIAAKLTGAFSGAMRPNLVSMLDRIGTHKWLGLKTAAELFGPASHLLQTASVLQNPVFLADGANYNGTPSMTKSSVLREQMICGFGKAAAVLEHAYFLPLGPKVSEAMTYLSKNGLIDESRVLHGMPHPSPASMERINYFLGKKSRELLSIKTNPDTLDAARDRLTGAMESMFSGVA